MPRLSSFAFLSALASLSLATACKSDDAGGPTSPQQPAATAAAPAPDDGAGDPGAGGPGGNMDARRAKRMQRFDTDGDGKLSREERQAMVADLIERRMRRLDTDRDGKLSRQETSGGGGRFVQHLSAEFDRADHNRDQFISREEMGKALRRFRAQRRAERQQAGGAAPGPAAPRGGGGAPPPAEDDDYGDSLDQ